MQNTNYYRDGVLFGKNWADGRFVLERNLYWNASGKPVVFPGGLTLAQWQARGFDKGSLVADPLFRAPNRGDFSLREGSPAHKIGFVPFDPSRAGPRKRP